MDISKVEETQNQRNAWQLHHDTYLLEQAELKMEEAKQLGLVPPGRGQKRKTLHETTELKKSVVPPPPGSVGTLEDRDTPIHTPLPTHTAQERHGSFHRHGRGLSKNDPQTPTRAGCRIRGQDTTSFTRSWH